MRGPARAGCPGHPGLAIQSLISRVSKFSPPCFFYLYTHLLNSASFKDRPFMAWQLGGQVDALLRKDLFERAKPVALPCTSTFISVSLHTHSLTCSPFCSQ